eukprot:GHVS01000360.1.p1 GENE.GHVS01000360.1~~GHVS01000360.1.p1  ORF type:complete len:148 (+),score=23.29 GHVS01000360.1:249-692(+)
MDPRGYRILAGIVVAAALLLLLHSIDRNLLSHRQILNRTQWTDWIEHASACLGPYAVHAKYASGVLAASSIGLCFSLFVSRVNRERHQYAEEEGKEGVSYCVNRMTDEEFSDKSLTRQSVMELINSPEYQKIMRDRAAVARTSAAST